MSNLVLTLMVGCPGSGKSFIAKALSQKTGGVICSTDDFFINPETGLYEFDLGRLGVNHLKCQSKARDLMKAKTTNVIIDNTNISQRDRKVYLDLGKEYGYTSQIVQVEAPIEVCIARNQHKVPEEVIKKMAEKLASQPTTAF